ncbi:MAG TPA: hydantoinase/oxoprolinase family protein [Gemmataceae bacterium]|nr:hydantoinase/oxoprolinase family protein [Gemmataceae bacterium]
MKRVLGLDIGGANLKLAHTDGTARTAPFELWKQPTQLAPALRDLIASAPAFDIIAVTMTGEMCDCFETRREGVETILDAVETIFGQTPLRIWRNDGRFVDMVTARQTPYGVASANWLALATFAGRFAPVGPALLIDMGSTTTDIIPVVDGKPVPQGRTDFERLQSGELLYRGVRRTPYPWTIQTDLTAELFATMLDAYLLLGTVPENAEDHGTADGRPATIDHAHTRLARMLGRDGDHCPPGATMKLARMAAAHVAQEMNTAIRRVSERIGSKPQYIMTAGSGEAVALQVIKYYDWAPPALLVSLKEQLGPGLSSAACAYAAATLAAEREDAN